VNGVIALLTILISKGMKRPTISSELKQAALWVFVVQMLNMGWLMFLGNLDAIRKMWQYFTPPS